MSVYISSKDREALSANMNRDMTIFDFYNDRAEYMRHISPSSSSFTIVFKKCSRYSFHINI